MLKKMLFNSTVIALFVSCGGKETKGPESQMPVFGSADTFRSPTYHGTVVFGVESGATFSDDTKFHAWDFTLKGAATISIRVKPRADNLDTVMYLYRRDPGATRWGKYIARNDDFEGQQWSGLDESLGLGEYLIMVKGYKENLRGRFSIVVNCDGICGTPLECPSEADSLPLSTKFGSACVIRIQQVLESELVNESTYELTESERCDAPAVVRKAWDYYYSYWENIQGWSDIRYDDEEPLAFAVEYTSFGAAGALVGVNYPGSDEMAITFLFDGQEEVLTLYQHNQSPDYQTFCAADVDIDQGSPDEDCFYQFTSSYRTGQNSPVQTGSVQLGDDPFDPPVLDYAIANYAADENIWGSYHEIHFEIESWEQNDDGKIYGVTLSSELTSTATYWFGSGWYGDFYYYVEGDSGLAFVCQTVELQ